MESDQSFTPDASEAAPAFEDYCPVPMQRARHDGWTEDRQLAFLVALAETGCVSEAAREAGISARSAYRLRAHPEGAAFGRAWDEALRLAAGRLVSTAYERALKGTTTQYWRDGKLVAETRAPSDKLLIWLLQSLNVRRNNGNRWNILEAVSRQGREQFDESLEAVTDNDLPLETDEPRFAPLAPDDRMALPLPQEEQE